VKMAKPIGTFMSQQCSLQLSQSGQLSRKFEGPMS
jgi:hypothetical protein